VVSYFQGRTKPASFGNKGSKVYGSVRG